MTFKSRLSHLEQNADEAYGRHLASLTDSAFFELMRAMDTEPPPNVRQRLKDEIMWRMRLLSDDALEAWIVAHSSPEEYAHIKAMSDAELETAIARDQW